jgi:hypothetical protein
VTSSGSKIDAAFPLLARDPGAEIAVSCRLLELRPTDTAAGISLRASHDLRVSFDLGSICVLNESRIARPGSPSEFGQRHAGLSGLEQRSPMLLSGIGEHGIETTNRIAGLLNLENL